MTPSTVNNEALTLHPVSGRDEAFLLELYASTRADLELAACDAATRALLVRMQFNAQQAHYRAAHPHASLSIVTGPAGPLGQLCVEHGADGIRLVDISLLPQYRRRGIGTRLLGGLMAQAGQAALPLRLSVLSDNPALALYRRLGFRDCGEAGMRRQMAWYPATHADARRASISIE